MELYTFFRSFAACRVRIALNFRGLAAAERDVHLRRGGGEQYGPDFAAPNPAARIPVLRDGNPVLAQPLAIIEHRDETHPETPLLPGDPERRALARSFAPAVACEIHPPNNLRAIQYLRDPLGLDPATRDLWYRHWVGTGLGASKTAVTQAGRAPDAPAH
jgi:maleylacetoacetate isomerase